MVVLAGLSVSVNSATSSRSNALKAPTHHIHLYIIRYGTVRYGTVRYGTVRYGTVRYGTVRYGTVQSLMIPNEKFTW